MANPKNELDVHINSIDNLSPDLDKLQSKIIRFVGTVSSIVATLKVVSFPVTTIREYEANLANVEKTTGFTEQAIGKLSTRLVELSRNINISTNDLARIAAAAGQQGLGREGVEGILAFTESVSRMSAVLDLTAEQAGADIGKIASIFKVPLQEIERAVSAFNETSNNSTATGEQLLDVVKRIGDAAGSLNLAQSIGLAATGIDLGLSPEVVGTNFTKIFSNMYAQADKFADLLKISVEDWTSALQENGVNALKMYVARLRTLTTAEQQKNIQLLSGGGRIGALVTKLVNDVEDAVLDRNVSFATKGFESASSAIREQQTVLQTLDATMTELSNSFTALGIAAGQEFVKPLTGYLAQLKGALADPEVEEFARAVGRGFLDVFTFIKDVVVAVKDLNINWGIFISAAKVFLALKLAQALAGWSLQVTGLSRAWAVYATDVTKAADAQAKAAKGSKLSQVFGLEEESEKLRKLSAQREAYRNSLALQKQAVEEVAKAEAALTAAEKARMVQGSKLRQAQEALGDSDANKNISVAKQAVAKAEAAAVAQVEQIRAVHNAKLEAAEVAHANKMVVIQQEAEAKRVAARAAGNRTEIAAINRDQETLIAAEEARHQRSIRGLNGYYNRRLNIIQTASVAEVAAAKAGLATALSEFDGAVQKANLPALTAGFKQADEAMVEAEKRLKAAQGTLQSTATQISKTQKAIQSFGAGIQMLGTIITGFMRIAGRLLFWATAIYTVFEAFGVTDKVVSSFQWLTDKLGITSEAARKLERQQLLLAEAQQKVAERTREAAEALEQYIDRTTNRITDEFRVDTEKLLSSKDIEAYRTGVNQLVDATEKLQAKLSVQQDLEGVLPIKKETVENELAILEEALAAARKRLERATKVMNVTMTGPVAASAQLVAASAQRDIVETTARIEELQKELLRYSDTSRAQIEQNRQDTEADLKALRELVKQSFTTESADVFLDVIPRFIEARKLFEDAQVARERANAEAKKGLGTGEEEALNKGLEDAINLEEQLRGNVAAIGKELGQTIAELKSGGGLSPAVVGSLDYLKEFLNFTTPRLDALLAQVKAVKEQGEEFTGEKAAPIVGSSSGDEEFDAAATAAEERRIRRARLELLRARLEAEAALSRELNQQRLGEEESFYEQGLLAIEDFFRERQRILEDNLAKEVEIRRKELDALAIQQEEINASDASSTQKQSESLRLDASVARVKGEIDVLLAQRDALAKETDRDIAKAFQDFSQKIADQQAAMVDFFGSSNPDDAFNAAVAQAELAARDWINKLNTFAADMPELTPLIDLEKFKIQAAGVEAALQSISRNAQLSTNVYERNQQRLEMLRDNWSISRETYERVEEQNRQALIKVREEEIRLAKIQLDRLNQVDDAMIRQTTRYRELQDSIAQMEMDVEELQRISTEEQRILRDSLRDNFKQSLISVAEDGKVRSAFKQLFIGLGESMQDIAADYLTDYILGALIPEDREESALSSLEELPKPEDTAPELGSSPALPLYVQMVNPLPEQPSTPTETGVIGFAPTQGDDTEEAVAATEGVQSAVQANADETKAAGQSVVGAVGAGANLVAAAQSGNTAAMVSSLLQVGTMIVAAISAQTTAETAAAVAHTGGIPRNTGFTRRVPAAVFRNAVRYHSGGVAGLAPDEVAAVLKKDEEVLRRDDPRHRYNGGLSGGAGGEGAVTDPNFVVQPVIGEDVVLSALKGTQGRKMLLVHISKDPGAFRNALNIK